MNITQQSLALPFTSFITSYTCYLLIIGRDCIFTCSMFRPVKHSHALLRNVPGTAYAGGVNQYAGGVKIRDTLNSPNNAPKEITTKCIFRYL